MAATLQSVKTLPLGGLGLLFGVDRIMATIMAITNIIGNTLAVYAVARWENAFDADAFEKQTGKRPKRSLLRAKDSLVETPLASDSAGGLAPVRADDLGAVPIKALMQRNPSVDWEQVDDLIYGCANQAGEDNRNVGRMSALLAGLPYQVPATTINRLCGSSLDAIAIAARAIKAGEANLVIAGGVESMSRAPYVMGKSDSAFGRSQKIEDTTMGWRFINPKLKELYGVDTMPQTAENVAEQFNVNRADQDQFALVSQQRTASAQAKGFFLKKSWQLKSLSVRVMLL